MELLREEVKVKMLAVVQRRDPETGTWCDEGRLGDVIFESFEKVAMGWLTLYRRDHPNCPPSDSRVVRRIVTTADEPMDW